MSDLLVKLKLVEEGAYGIRYMTGLGGTLASLGVLAATFAAVIGMWWPFAYQGCQNYAQAVEVEYEWDFFAGCFLEYEDRMVPRSVWHNNQSDTTLELEQR